MSYDFWTAARLVDHFILNESCQENYTKEFMCCWSVCHAFSFYCHTHFFSAVTEEIKMRMVDYYSHFYFTFDACLKLGLSYLGEAAAVARIMLLSPRSTRDSQ